MANDIPSKEEIVINLNDPILTTGMLKAGMDAFRGCDQDKEAPELMIASVYYSMIESLSQRTPSS